MRDEPIEPENTLRSTDSELDRFYIKNENF